MCLVLPNPDSGGREGWSWRPGGLGWLAPPWTQVDRSGQSPECPPLSERPLSPPQLPLPRAKSPPLSAAAPTWKRPICGSGTLSGSLPANLCQPKTDLRILHVSIVASRQFKDFKLLPAGSLWILPSLCNPSYSVGKFAHWEIIFRTSAWGKGAKVLRKTKRRQR